MCLGWTRSHGHGDTEPVATRGHTCVPSVTSGTRSGTSCAVWAAGHVTRISDSLTVFCYLCWQTAAGLGPSDGTWARWWRFRDRRSAADWNDPCLVTQNVRQRRSHLAVPYLDALHADVIDDPNDATRTGHCQQGVAGVGVVCPRTRVEVLVCLSVCGQVKMTRGHTHLDRCHTVSREQQHNGFIVFGTEWD